MSNLKARDKGKATSKHRPNRTLRTTLISCGFLALAFAVVLILGLFVFDEHYTLFGFSMLFMFPALIATGVVFLGMIGGRLKLLFLLVAWILVFALLTIFEGDEIVDNLVLSMFAVLLPAIVGLFATLLIRRIKKSS